MWFLNDYVTCYATPGKSISSPEKIVFFYFSIIYANDLPSIYKSYNLKCLPTKAFKHIKR